MFPSIDSIACVPQCNTSIIPLDNHCNKKTFKGRLVDLYFIPCEEWNTATIEADIIDLSWWNGLLTIGAEKLKRLGKGIGSVAPSEQTKLDTGGCYGEELESIEYELTYLINLFDNSPDFLTHEIANSIMNGALHQYNLVARYCEPDDTILVIGRAKLEALNDTTPPGNKEYQTLEYKLRWTPNKLSTQGRLKVPGLNTVMPI